MSKIYDNYLELKSNSKKYFYLFECGNFYIFLDDDARKINQLFDLKLVEYNKSVLKCGFPKNSLEKYMKLFKNKKLKIKVIENKNKGSCLNNVDQIKKVLKNINVNDITPIEALCILKEIKELMENFK